MGLFPVLAAPEAILHLKEFRIKTNMENDHDREEELFMEWLQLSPDERKAFIDTIGSENPEVRDGLRELIESHQASEDFLDNLPQVDFTGVAGRLKRIAPSEEKVGDQIGRYRLEKWIDEGAWGTVWLARQTEDIRRQVALKILKLGLDTKDFLTRFEAERQMLAMMEHPSIATIYDAGATDFGRPFLVMELVKGKPLLEYADEKKLSIEARVELYIRICQALEHAHQKDVIHRDIKPSNILVAETDDGPVPKVIDFGVAKSNQYRLGDKIVFTSIDTFVGTPAYSSPEQLEFSVQDVDKRSDIYSLGALLYEFLSGIPPFDHEKLTEEGMESLRAIVREKDPALPSVGFASLTAETQDELAKRRTTQPVKLGSQLKGDLDWIIMKCLEKDRDRRYESAQALADDLRAFLDCRPVSAAAPSAMYRAGKFIRRNRLGPVAWGVGATALVLFLVYAVFLPKQSPLSVSSPFSTILSENSRSVAVLPFENLSANEDDAFIAEGVFGELTTVLSRIKDIKTVSRKSTTMYRDTQKSPRKIGEELGVVTLVNGDVQRLGDNIRINVQLIDVIDDRMLWGETYIKEYNPTNFFEIQSEICAAIAEELHTVLSPEESRIIAEIPTQSMEALEAYFKAEEIRNSNANRRFPEAIELYEKAIELDPQFAQAYGGLAASVFGYAVYFYQGGRGYLEFDMTPEEGKARRDELQAYAREVAAKGLALDDSLPDLRLTVAVDEMHYGDRDVSKASIEAVIEEYPNNAVAHLCLGWWYWNFKELEFPRWNQTLDNPDWVAYVEKVYQIRKKVTDLNPSDPQNRMQMVLTLNDLGRVEEALAEEALNVSLHPKSGTSYVNSSISLLANGRFVDAMIYLRKYNELEPGLRIVFFITLYENLGDVEEAVRWAERAQLHYPSRTDFYEAIIHRLRGEVERSANWHKKDAPEAMVFRGNIPAYAAIRNFDLRNGLIEEQKERYRAFDPLHFETNIVELVEANDPQLQDKNPTSWCIQAMELAAFLIANDEEEQAERLLDAAQILLERHTHPSDWKVLGIFYGAPGDSPYLFYQAIYHSLRGEEQRALTLLREAVDQGFRDRLALGDARFDSLRDEPEFTELMEIIETDLVQKLANIRQMELKGELAAIPKLPEPRP